MNDLEYILSPRSIAVVGASNRQNSLGLAVFKNLIEGAYQGILYPVNPKANSVRGVKAYKTLMDIPDEVDMAVLIITSEHVEEVIEQAAKKGVKGCIVITAGFKEIGGRGVELENKVKAAARARGIRMLGPNCLGAANTNKDVLMNASFARGMPKPGNIAFISQSGAMCVAVLDYAAGRNMGFSKFVSIGNKADINEIDLLRYFRDDADTKVIIMYIEDVTDGHAFIEIGRDITFRVGKPILCSFMGLVDVSDGVRYLEQNGIPNYAFPEEASRTMAAMITFTESLKPHKGMRREVFRLLEDQEKAAAAIAWRLSGRKEYFMTEKEAHELLQCYGFPLLKSRLVKDPLEIKSAVEEVGFPAVMKLDSPDILHKSDAGGVRLGIQSFDEAERAFHAIMASAKRYKPSAFIRGVLFQQMAREGVEVILGSTRDPKFGPICMFGLGGIFVEAMKDVSFRLAPMWETSAENMIKSIKAYRVLRGIRGKPPADIKATELCILRLSAMVSNHPEIAELDINPLIVYPEGKGCVVADARIVLSRPGLR